MCAKGGGKVAYKIDPEQARNAAYQQLTSLANYQPSLSDQEGLQKYQALGAMGTPPPYDLPETSPPEPAPPEPHVDPMEARFKGLIMDEEKKE